MPGLECRETYEALDPQPPGTGEIIALQNTPYGLVAIRRNEQPYLLRPDATEWEALRIN